MRMMLGNFLVLTEDWCFVGRGETTHHRHQEHGHVEHGGDAQRDLLTRFSWDKEDTSCNQELFRIVKYSKVLQSQNVDENSRLNVIKQEELWFSPDKKEQSMSILEYCLIMKYKVLT